MEILYQLFPLIPIIINIVCIKAKKGKILSLIVTLIGVLISLFYLMINNGYGIGFGNPWVGVDWGFTTIFLIYTAVLLVTHALVPSSGTVKKVSVVFIVLAGICALYLTATQIINTVNHI